MNIFNIILNFILPCSIHALGLSFGIHSLGGVLSQPTSGYYHAYYGASIETGSEKQKFLVRTGYFERPELATAIRSETGESVFYRDKEYGYFFQLGTKVTDLREQGIFVFGGIGRLYGIIESQSLIRRYDLPGLHLSAEYQKTLKKKFILAAGHQTFVGYVDRRQLDAFVAWPYNMFYFAIGYHW